jgi:hypothetical protein
MGWNRHAPGKKRKLVSYCDYKDLNTRITSGFSVRLTGAKSHLPILAILLMGAIFICIPSLPGRMSNDSFAILGQVSWQQENRALAPFDDWHPPFISYLCSFLPINSITISAITILFAWLFLSASYVIFRAEGISSALALAAALALALLPPVYGCLTAFSKDTWVAVLILVVLALMVVPTSANIGLQALRGALLAFCIIVRKDLIVTLPIFLMAEASLYKHQTMRRTAVLAMWIGMGILTVSIITNTVIRPVKTAPIQQIFLFDLAALSVRSDKLLLPANVFPSQNFDVLKKHFWPTSLVPILFGEPKEEMLQRVPASEVREIIARWAAAVVLTPSEYLGHRLEFASAYLSGYWPYHPGVDANKFNLEPLFPKLLIASNRVISSAPPVLFSHYLPLIGSLVLVGVYTILKTNNAFLYQLFLVFSIVYQCLFVFIAASPDFRYGYASVCVFYLLLFLCLLKGVGHCYQSSCFKRGPA